MQPSSTDDSGRLAGYLYARETHIGPEGNWELREVEQKVITERGGFLSREMERLVLSDLLTGEQAAVLAGDALGIHGSA